MNDPMQLDTHLEIRRRKVEEQSHAYTYLDALTRDKNIAAITALREHLARPAKLFQLDEDGTLEVRSLHSDTLPSPLAFWQESSVFVLLWQQSLLLRLHRQTDLMGAAEVAGRVLSSSENTASQQPFLLYVVLAYLAIVYDVPTPAQLQLMRAVAESAEGKMPLDDKPLPVGGVALHEASLETRPFGFTIRHIRAH